METDKDIEIGKVNDMIDELNENPKIDELSWNISQIKKILKRLNR